MEGLYSEHNVVKPGARGDLNGAETARISMKELFKLACVIDVASLANDVVITLQQHDAATGGNSKDLVSKNPCYVKPDGDTEFTKKDASGAAAITIAELNGAAGVAIAEIVAEDLDVDGGFSHVSVQINTTAARVGSAVYHSHSCRKKPASEVSI